VLFAIIIRCRLPHERLAGREDAEMKASSQFMMCPLLTGDDQSMPHEDSRVAVAMRGVSNPEEEVAPLSATTRC
jgi:hypothetical protein